jgi:PAS domain S-box-containing protein
MSSAFQPEELDLRAEIVRLNKMVDGLRNRVELADGVQAATGQEKHGMARSAALADASIHEIGSINRALRESEAKFRGLVNQSLVGIAISEDGQFTLVNHKLNEIFGYGAGEILALRLVDLVHAEDRQRVDEKICQRLQVAIDQVNCLARVVRKNGQVITIEINGDAMDLGGRQAFIFIIMDVTDRIPSENEVKLLQEMLREQSIHDSLTGLFNRRYLDETLARELTLADREKYTVSPSSPIRLWISPF